LSPGDTSECETSKRGGGLQETAATEHGISIKLSGTLWHAVARGDGLSLAVHSANIAAPG